MTPKEWSALLGLHAAVVEPLLPANDTVAVALLYFILAKRIKSGTFATPTFVHDALALHIANFNDATKTRTV